METSFKQRVFSKYRIISNVTLSHLEAEAKRLLDKFFAEYNLPVPHFRIVNTPREAWLGITYFSPKEPDNTTIKLQKKALEDPKTLERILCHELIHHKDFLTGQPQKSLGDKGHGEGFKRYAERINAVMGANFVTAVSDLSYNLQSDKDYFLLIIPAKYLGYDGRYAYSFTLSPSAKQKSLINKYIAENDGKLFKVKNEELLNGSAIGTEFSIPKEKEVQEKLKGLYTKGTQVQHSL